MTLKKSENPPIVISDTIFASCQKESSGYWWVIKTKPRQEKALAWNLASLKIPYFLPLITKPQKNKKRLRFSIVPLFSGYLFIKCEAESKLKILSTNRVAHLIEVEDQKTLEKELENIYKFVQGKEKKDVTICDFLTKGKKVRILDGPMEGTVGIIKKNKNETKLYVQLTMFNRAACVEIDNELVEPI